MTSSTLIHTNNLSVSYNSHPVITNVNVSIGQYDFTGVIGPNGGGKTTFIKALMGLVRYDGDIEYGPGVSISNGSIGYMPQINNFDYSFPIIIKDIIISGLQNTYKKNKAYNATSNNEKADELMELTNISHIKNKSIKEVSGGQLQRALLCRALISAPKLLILDEPTNFIDNEFEKELYPILQNYNKKMGIIIVSHDLNTILPFVTRVIYVNRILCDYKSVDKPVLY